MSSVYIIHSKALDTYYIGATEQDSTVRLVQHNSSFYGSKSFTSKAKDWTLVLELKCMSKAHSLRLEKKVKSMKSNRYIENLLKYKELRYKIIKETR